MLTMDVNQASLARTNRLLEISFGPQVARSLSRAANSAKTAMVKAMAGELTAPQSKIKKYVVTSPATPERLVSRVYLIGRWKKGIPLINFDARGPEPSRGKGTGVRASGQIYPHAFIATMPRSGHRGVFERRGRARLPIDELRSSEPLQALFKRLRPIGVARGAEALKINLAADLKFALSKRL